MICSIENCNNKHYARTWCYKHYLRWFRNGDPQKIKKFVPWNKGKTGVYSKETLEKMSKNNARANLGKTGPASHLWKGDKAKYQAKHKWIRERFGKADHCSNENCENKNAKVFHWANLSGEYKRINDWIQLCASCHKKHDLERLS